MCKMKWPAFLLLPMLLTGCVADQSEPKPVASAPTILCPTIVQYSKEFQNKWADELEKTPPDSTYRTVTNDYANLRDRIRACKSN